MSELQTVNILSEMDIKMNTVHEPSIFYPCKRDVPFDHVQMVRVLRAWICSLEYGYVVIWQPQELGDNMCHKMLYSEYNLYRFVTLSKKVSDNRLTRDTLEAHLLSTMKTWNIQLLQYIKNIRMHSSSLCLFCWGQSGWQWLSIKIIILIILMKSKFLPEIFFNN